MKKIFLDSDVILDLFLKRDPYFHYSLELFNAISDGKFKAYTTVIIFTNVNYIISRAGNKNEVRKHLSNLKSFVGIIDTGEKILNLALGSDFEDFEDAVQYYAALDKKLDFIITRNKRDFKKSIIPALAPEELLAQIQ